MSWRVWQVRDNGELDYAGRPSDVMQDMERAIAHDAAFPDRANGLNLLWEREDMRTTRRLVLQGGGVYTIAYHPTLDAAHQCVLKLRKL